jgi:recombination DNA repair RAD52 pathway protein
VANFALTILLKIDYIQETQRYNVGVTAIVRVSLRDGVWHEDIGYGMLENSKSKGMAIDKVRGFLLWDFIISLLS